MMPFVTISVFSLLVTSTFGSQRRLQTYTQTSDYEAIMLERVNLERGAQGLAPLCTNSKLRLAAQLHSDDQAANDFMDHTGSDGRTVVDRVSAAGYDWRGVAENVAAGQIDVTEVMDAWMNSKGHRENILGDYTMLGSAYAYTPDGNYNHFWTQNFGWSDTDVCDGMTPTSNGPNNTSLISDPVANSSNPRDNRMSAPSGRDSRDRSFISSCSILLPSLHVAITMMTILVFTST